MYKLSSNLQSIYKLELSLGNEVSRIDEPAGSLCPLAVIFKNRLHFDEIAEKLNLSASVYQVENHDLHYPLEAGYKDSDTDHVIVGPLA